MTIEGTLIMPLWSRPVKRTDTVWKMAQPRQPRASGVLLVLEVCFILEGFNQVVMFVSYALLYSQSPSE
jgi:hypothetical protein